MRSRSRALLDKSIGAMISAIEVYNKPSFKYREETFAVLAINAWELLLKAKWLKDNNNEIKSLYVMEYKNKQNGKPSKIPTPRLTASKNPYTVSIKRLATELEARKILTPAALANLEILIDIRDSAVHFYNKNIQFAKVLQEVGCAAVKNFATACEEWFGVSLAEYNLYLMPIAFLAPDQTVEAFPLNSSEANVANFIAYLDENVKSGDYSIAVKMSIKFDRGSEIKGLKVRLSNEADAIPVRFSDEQMRDKYPLDYESLTDECRTRYANFLSNQKYHDIREPLKADSKYCHVRLLNPKNPNSAKQEWYSRAIFTELDKHYRRKLVIPKAGA